jgi:hypothetical protein
MPEISMIARPEIRFAVFSFRTDKIYNSLYQIRVGKKEKRAVLRIQNSPHFNPELRIAVSFSKTEGCAVSGLNPVHRDARRRPPHHGICL